MEKTMSEVTVHVQGVWGDKKLTFSWDSANANSVEAMRRQFDQLKKDGFTIYECKKLLGVVKRKGKEVHYFDPSAGELIYEAPKHPNKTKDKLFDMHETEVEGTSPRYEIEKVLDTEKEDPKPEKEYLAMTGMRAG